VLRADIAILKADALALGAPGSPLAGQTFDAVLDSGIFHIWSDVNRIR
jgi:hypothetical protein